MLCALHNANPSPTTRSRVATALCRIRESEFGPGLDPAYVTQLKRMCKKNQAKLKLKHAEEVAKSKADEEAAEAEAQQAADARKCSAE